MRMRIYAYKLRMRWTLISERYCSSSVMNVVSFGGCLILLAVFCDQNFLPAVFKQ